ncbi:hypothetical protein AB0L71_15425 [Streptomyces sp. NPDC052052]|uniref:hypothetical protein n=1 Tax=Streptomyces sp. NPDC052052 TaxID=3154756 RepID=UPI00342AA881
MHPSPLTALCPAVAPAQTSGPHSSPEAHLLPEGRSWHRLSMGVTPADTPVVRASAVR